MFTGLNPSGNSWSSTSSVKHKECAAPLYLGVPRCSNFVVLYCMLEHAFLAHRWIWLHHPFDASPHVDRVLACVRRRLPLYVGHEVVYPTVWLFCFLIAGALRPHHQI